MTDPLGCDPFGCDAPTLARSLTRPPRALVERDPALLRSAPELSALWAEVAVTAAAAAADLSRGTEPDLAPAAWLSYAERGDRLPYEDLYFGRRRRLIALALATCFGDDTHLAALERMIGLVGAEPTWALPAHVPDPTTMAHRTVVDLFAAETGQTLAEIRTLLDGRLSPGAAEVIRTEVIERVIDPMRPGTVPLWWETAPMNWAAVCGGSVLMAALHTETDPTSLAPLVLRCLGALEVFLTGFGTDGCCAEGLAYWSYGFGYFTAAADLLERATGGTVRIADDPRAVRAAAYGHRADLGHTRTLTYSDVGPGLPTTSIPCWWAERGVPPISAARLSLPSDDPCGRWALLLRTILWSRPLPATAPDHTDVFESSGLVVANHGPYALSIKGGHNAEPHNHLDLGHVSVWLGADQVIADIGSGVYTAAYFSDQRYSFLHPSARAHNGPIVLRDGIAYEQQPGPTARADLTVTATDADGQADLDLTAAYGEDIGARLTRTVTWTWAEDRGAVEITDRVTGDDAAGEFVVRFLSSARPEIHGTTATWSLDTGSARLHGPAGVEILMEPLHTLDHDSEPVTWWAIESRTRLVGDPVRHTLTLTPQRG